MTDTAAMQLGRFCASTGFDDIPPDVVARARQHMLDTFGAALAGSAAFEPRQLLGTLIKGAARSGVPVWGTGVSLGGRDATFANGSAAHALELDDTGGCDHSGAVVLPAAMATLAMCRPERLVTGRELLTAVVIGYDVGRRVLEACGGYSPHNAAGWHSTATCGTFGAAAAAAYLMRLNAAQTTAAFGHAASFSGGLWAFIHDASQTKRLHAGRAAEGGLTAALLAAQGISGPTQVFDDVWGGFFNTFAPQSKQPDALLADLGHTWKLMRSSIKPHASCRSNHATIDAVIHLMAAHPGLAQRVRHVDVKLSEFVMGMCGGRDVSTLASAQMSMPYAVAVAWVHGNASLERYLSPARADARLAAAMSLVRLEVDPAMAALDAPLVTITPDEGSAVSHSVPIALGAPDNPMTSTALRAKFQALATVALTRTQADALADQVLHLDEVDDAGTLLHQLAGRSEAHALIC